MRLVFLGTPQAAVPALEALSDAGHDVVLAVSQPDRPVGRSRSPRPTPVKRAASERGIEVFQPVRVRDAAFRDRLAAVRPELLVVVAYGRLLTRAVLELAPRGSVNLHFSLLPRYRGAAPVQWALAHGETTTGASTMRINERLDEGDVYLQEALPVAPDEHAPELERRLAGLGAGLLVRTLAEWDRLEPRAQEATRASYAPLLSRADGEVDPQLTAVEIAGRVRGFDPWPGVWVACSGRRLRIVRARPVDGAEASAEPPGTLVGATKQGLLLACGGGSQLLLLELQAEGGRPMAARDMLHGRQLAIGDRFLAATRSH